MIIGLAGVARSGKDTLADYLVDNHGFVKVAFADPMREALFRLSPRIQVNNGGYADLSTAVRMMGWERLKEYSPDVRALLQRMGTEVGRDMFGEHFWVDLAIKKALTAGSDVVISDVRYKNEAQSIEQINGLVVKVERPGVVAANAHTSEHDLEDYYFSHTILNEGTLDDLHSKMSTILEYEPNNCG
jgi:hypothetical protein